MLKNTAFRRKTQTWNTQMKTRFPGANHSIFKFFSMVWTWSLLSWDCYNVWGDWISNLDWLKMISLQGYETVLWRLAITSKLCETLYLSERRSVDWYILSRPDRDTIDHDVWFNAHTHPHESQRKHENVIKFDWVLVREVGLCDSVYVKLSIKSTPLRMRNNGCVGTAILPVNIW